MIGAVSFGAINKDSCQANFSYTSNNGKVSFFDNSTTQSTLVAYSWNFGDGTSSTTRNPVHIYGSNVFNVTVCLQITQKNKSICTVCKNVAIRHVIVPVTCKARFTYAFLPDGLNNTTTVAFYDSSSVNTTSWTWNFGDGTSSQLKNPSRVSAA